MRQIHNVIISLILFLSFQCPAFSEDYASSYAQEEPLFINQDYPRGLKEEDLRNLPLSDPNLRVAYCFLLRTATSWGPIVDKTNPEMQEVLNDLKRRGDSATPLWIDMMAKNPNTSIETYAPRFIERIEGINMKPYVDYFRDVIKNRPDEISATANEEAASLFLKYGTREDVKMMQELAEKRPFLAPSLKRAFESEERRAAFRVKSTGQASATPEPVPPATQLKPAQAPAQPSQVPESGRSALWGLIAILMIAPAFGLWRWLQQRAK